MRMPLLICAVAFSLPVVVLAHSGRTDANGGHYNRKTGEYHYHGTPRQSSSGYTITPLIPSSVSPSSQLSQSNSSYNYARFTESDWQIVFNNKVTHGKLEVETPTGRIDILTDTHVIEVDHARNYRAAIKQALQYAGATKKKAGIALIMDGTQDTFQAVEAAKKLCEESDVTFWLINEYVSVNDLVDQKPQTKTAPPPQSAPQQQYQQSQQTQTIEQGYWLNTKSGVRHNRRCRWYGNTINGRPCGPNEGRACKQCGG